MFEDKLLKPKKLSYKYRFSIIEINSNCMIESEEVASKEEEHEIIVICPTCKTKKELKIPTKIINQAKQLTTVSIPSGTVCEHGFQSFVDKNFKVRGYQKVDFEFSHMEFFESGESTEVAETDDHLQCHPTGYWGVFARATQTPSGYLFSRATYSRPFHHHQKSRFPVLLHREKAEDNAPDVSPRKDQIPEWHQQVRPGRWRRDSPGNGCQDI